MAFGKQRKKIRESLGKWKCLGLFGYGQGRAVRDFGRETLGNRSVCLDVCEHRAVCRKIHNERMDEKYPVLAQIVSKTIMMASERGQSVPDAVTRAMEMAEERGAPGSEEVRRVLDSLGIDEYTDHYICGQFQNIQRGFSGDPASVKSGGDAVGDNK